jgi:predicted nucleic acid-binding protein
VLQGFGSQRDFDQARKLLTGLEAVDIGGRDIALQAARHYRALRERGITILKTIDTLIATRCIEPDCALL